MTEGAYILILKKNIYQKIKIYIGKKKSML